MIHAHLRNGLPFHILEAQIFPPEAVKMRMMLVSAAQHGSGHKTLFLPIGHGHCQQLHRFIFMWWEKIPHRDFRLTLIRHVGMVLALATTTLACGETSPSFY